jgi:hypothetical protein
VSTEHAYAPRPPDNLGVAGRALWRAVLSDYRLADHECVLLANVCHQVDLLHDLEAATDAEPVSEDETPGQCRARLAEATTLLGAARAQVARLINGLHLPQLTDDESSEDDEGSSNAQPLTASAYRSQRASNAARARWAKAR